jgi:hypothetical protein
MATSRRQPAIEPSGGSPRFVVFGQRMGLEHDVDGHAVMPTSYGLVRHPPRSHPRRPAATAPPTRRTGTSKVPPSEITVGIVPAGGHKRPGRKQGQAVRRIPLALVFRNQTAVRLGHVRAPTAVGADPIEGAYGREQSRLVAHSERRAQCSKFTPQLVEQLLTHAFVQEPVIRMCR